MPSTNKTKNLKLNSWESNDRPMRNDFNSDNAILDNIVGGHVANENIHITPSEKAYLKDFHVTDMYAGTGENTKKISFTEPVRFVMVFAEEKPMSVYDSTSGKTKSYCAAGYVAVGASSGLSISATGTSITVMQGDDGNGNLAALNEIGVQYKVVIFK